MNLHVRCAHCDFEFGIPPESDGKKVQCLSCCQTNRITLGDDGSAGLIALHGPDTGSQPVQSQPLKADASKNSDVETPEGDVTVFIFGILGLCFCQILGVFGLTTWSTYSEKCAQVGAEPSTLAQVGRALSIASLVILGLSVLLVLIFIPVAAMGG